MSLFLENSFPLNNYISISNKIKVIPLFFLYFLPIIHFKNLDEHYKVLSNSTSNLIQREIKYKIIDLYNPVDCDNSITFPFTIHLSERFAKSIYHIFYSCSILHKNNISFTLSSQPFVLGEDDLPRLSDYSYSFYFPTIQSNNMKLYFPRSLLQNPYISLDVFIITHLLYEPNDCLSQEDINTIIELFVERREKLKMKIEINKIKDNIYYFQNYNSTQVIQYLLQFKYSWTYYSLCSFFIINHSDLLKHFSLYDLFYSYIHSSFNERGVDFVQLVHTKLFCL